MNGFAHLVLDSIVGDIWWLAPFLDRPFSLFRVPAAWTPWSLNFIGHWTFGIETGLLLAAVYLWLGPGSVVRTSESR